VEEAASSRRAKSNLGDVTFSLCTAVLGCALLFAAGQHLFAPIPDAITQSPAPHTGLVIARAVAATVVVPLARKVAVPSRRDHRTAPSRNVRPRANRARQTPRVPQSRQASHTSRVHDAPRAPRVLGASHASSAFRTSHRNGARPRAAVHSARSAGVDHAASVTARAAIRHAARKVVARATFGTSRPRSLAHVPRAANRAFVKRQRAIIEPPLGYETRPALALAPAAAALELDAPALPSIRPRRHH
jgi:hypothetical protein